MLMWSALEKLCPAQVDKLMLEFVNNRAANSKYVIGNAEEKFLSKEGVETAFNDAYDKSIYGKRDFPENFLYYSEKGDKVPLLITNEDMRSTNLLFAYFSNSIMTAPSGKETDLRIASLVAHLHPKKGRNFFSIRFF